jgi:uncharacterized protein (UPF0264 family)
LQLLVSVRDSGEVEAALDGGADIIDAKEPARGALGPVAPDRLRAIDDCVPDDVPFSLALGDATSEAEVVAGIAMLPLRRRPAPVFLKLGISAAATGGLERLLATAVRAAGNHPASPRLIAVEYADPKPRRFPPNHIVETAAQAGAAGVLIDTAIKDGRTLFAWWTESRLRAWIDDARGRGLCVAVAGSLGVSELPRVVGLSPDILGVRGAACVGGRVGVVQADRVRALRAALAGESQAAANRQSRGASRGPQSILK